MQKCGSCTNAEGTEMVWVDGDGVKLEAPLPEQSYFVTQEGDKFRFKRQTDGQCLGAKMCGATVCEDGRLERNNCDADDELQLFEYNETSKHLTSMATGKLMCVTTCADTNSTSASHQMVI